jgi:hypothetical protein
MKHDIDFVPADLEQIRPEENSNLVVPSHSSMILRLGTSMTRPPERLRFRCSASDSAIALSMPLAEYG